MIQINHEILSFYDFTAVAERSVKTVLLVRHSYRESLKNGSHDPGLTPEGWEYAKECGALLKGLKDVCYGSSRRQRTLQTIEALREGGELEQGEIRICPEIFDTAIFQKPEDLDITIDNGSLPRLLQSFYMTGKAERMIDLPVYHKKLFSFLTETSFEKKNVILASHDNIVAALLLPLNVYPFQQSDWCGYVQGAALYQSADGDWTIGYIVPDKTKRKKHALFI